MKKLNKTVSKILFSGILLSLLLLVGSCENWMSSDSFMSDIESEVHDANASLVNVYVRYANSKMGTTEPSGNTAMKIDVASKLSAVTSDEYGFVKWAAFPTSKYSTDKQHKNLIYITEDDYNKNYKEIELKDSVVHFSNPTSPSTEVKILSSLKNDDGIFLMPIVAERPAVDEENVPHDPGREQQNVILNKSIRIIFTKAIDEKTLYDEDGNPNFSVKSGNPGLTDNESEMDSKDITNLFDVSLSETGKMLTFKLKTERDENNNIIKQELFDIRKRVTVVLYEEICDTYGFSMKDKYSFSFVTGTSADDLAPMIEVLYGGIGENCDVFVTFGEDGEMKGSATKAAKEASRENIENPEYTDYIFAQRVYDKLNIFVMGNDIMNSGDIVPNPATDLSEDNVSSIGIAASLYFDNDGNPVEINATNSIAADKYIYIPGRIDSNSQIKKLFSEVVPKDGNGKSYTSGTVYTYDISSLPDGLIRIDVWGIDMTGNSGGPNDTGAPYYTTQDNGFKSIFVVKDTTPIDSAEVNAKKQVKSSSKKAPYYWYNKESVENMELFDSPENKIHDAGHPKLRALDKNLWWTFKVGNVKEKVLADDAGWNRIHDAESGETSLHYSLSDVVAPEKDGPVDITLYLKDDMDNISDPVLLDSIMYDDTKPTVSLKNDKGDFIKANGEPVQNNSKTDQIEQILKVDFTEDNAQKNVDAVSGIRQMEIHITKNGVEVPAPRNNEFKVLYVPSTVENPTPGTTAEEGLREIQIAENDPYNSNNLVVFDVDDSNKITSGTFFISGLTLGDTDGPWEVSVELYDSALNKVETPATTIMKRDTTPPAIEKIFVNDALKREVYNDSGKDSWWMPVTKKTADGFYNVTFDIYVNETGSGLRFIKLPENVDIDFTDNTKLSADGISLVRDIDYSFDSETDMIKMLDEFYPKFINTEADGSKIHFRLEDVKLNINDTASGNRAGIEVEDFVDNIKENKTLTYSDNSTGTLIFTDTKTPKISDFRIEDSAKNNKNNPDDIGYNNQYADEADNSIKYTDEQKVSLLLTLEPETVSGSGVKTVHLSENAEFTSETEIEVNGTALSRTEWTRSDNKSITFKKVFINADKIKFTNVRLDSTTNGEQFIHAYLTDLAGIDTEVSYKSVGIIYDDKQPEIKNIEWVAPQFVAKGSANGNTVEDQTFKVDFEELTSGVKVIKFDINYKPNDGEEETKSYEKPFDLDNFEIYYGDKLLINKSDYSIAGQYIILNIPVITENGELGTFKFENIKLCDEKAEGNYIIYVTLLDAAENINPQKETEGAVYKEEIVIDTTKPIVEKVQVLGAKKREVYGNPSDSHKWWMPKNSSPNVNLDVTINEDGASIQVIKLSEDVEFTPDTKLYLKKSGVYLTENEDYLLDTTENTIKLLDKYFAKKLIRNDNENQFVLENVKLKNANTFNGNKVALGLEDFVRNEGYNQNGADYKIYFDNNETLEEGTLVYLDSEKPVVAELTIEDSEQNEDNNPDKKGNDDTTKYNYTDDEDVIIILKLTPENDKDGSGVKKVTLSKNAKFAINGGSQIFVNDDIHSLTITKDYKFNSETEVEFTKVFTGNETIKFTNIRLLCDEQAQGEQSVSAKLTDFVELDSEIATSNNTIIYDNVAPIINEIKWTSNDLTDSNVSLTNSETSKIYNKTLNVKFKEETAGVKVIKFDITHDGNSYATPFKDGYFELLYNSNKVADTKYDIDGQYIILKEPKDYKSGIFSFNNLTLNGDNDEGQYIINVTLLDAAENINEQTDSSIYNCKLSIDKTPPVIERVDVLEAIDRTDYSDNTNTSTWWMPADKFETDGENTELSKVDLKVTINEIGSGIRYIKLSEDAEFTDNTVLTRVDSDVSLIKDTDYKLDDNHTIELLNPNNPKLNGTAAQPIVIKLENVKLNKINAAEGNKVKVEVEDFVYHDNSNTVTGGYKIYYDEKDYSGLVVYADYTKPVITTLNIKDSAHDSNVNPDSEGLDLDHYTNDQNVELILTLGAESTSAGSGVRIIHLENNAKFTTESEIFVDNVKLASDKYDITESYVDFRNRVFTAANTIRFTNVHMISGDDKHGQTISAKLTDFVGLESNDKVSDPITLDQHAPQINNIKWIIPDNSVAEGSVNKEEVTDQTLRINFTEKTAGVKVIKLDVTYENDTDSYATPFAASQALELYYGDEPLTLGTDYKIEKGRYIVLTQPRTTGVFNIKNIKLKNTALQGDYEIKITLLDAAENVDIKSGSVTVDTTHPVIEKVLVKEAVPREVYNDASNAQKWWMPESKFATEGNVDLEITVDEAGSGLKIIQLSQDVELTSTTKLVIPEKTIAEGADKDYVLDTANNTITINNFDAKLLRNNNSTNSHIVFTLTNVKLKVINSVETGAGNKVAVKVVDFVNNDGTNEISGSAGNYKIFYPDDSDGTLIFADLTQPEITNLRMEDSEQNTENNSENKGTDKTKYTDSQNVVVYLTLKAETLSHGSGVKKISLTDNAVFTDTTEIFVDGTPLTTGITWAADKKSVVFDKVFIAANVIKFTNVNLISDENKADQTISAKLTDFVENITENDFVSETITLDTHAPVINSINWYSDDATVSLTNSQSNEIRNKSLKINFTDISSGFGSGVKVIRFDIEHNGLSYTAPFGLTDFSLDYDGTVLTKGTDYTIDGRYIILTTSENYKSGVFTFNNLKLNGTPAEGKYVVKVTLLDAAENKNAQTESSVYNKSLSIDTTDPVIASVQVLDSISRIDYSDSTNGITWWMPSSKFDAEGNLTAVDLKLTINEIGSGIRFIKLSEDVEYTENTILKLIENDIESTLVEGTDYTLNQQTRTIELLDHDNAKLNGTESNPNIIIKLENVKLNKINSAAGNKIAVEVEDFVYHPTTNKIANTTSDYQISYADGTTGKVVYADYTAPSIADLRIEDSAQNENNNPENIGYNNQYTSTTDNTKKYTDSRDVVLLLKLTSEKLSNGSGIKTVKLSANATFTNETHIYVDGTELASTGFTFASDYKSVNFTKVFTQANTLKFTNVHLGSGNNGDQTINADLTDFVGNNTTSSTTSVAITYDSAAPVITAMAWEAESSAIALGHAFNQNVSNQILRVDFTELTAGTKVIKFDIDHEGAGSYATPFALTSFKLMYGDTELTKGTDYTINGRYIILKEPKTSGTFRFSNIQISDTAIPEEGRYNIKVTLLDAAENINPQESGDVYSWPISVDTTAPAIQKVQVLGAESRIDYSNAAAGETWWIPASKFDTNGDLSKVALKLVIKEAGSGLRNIKLSQDVQFTSATILKKIVGETESTLTAGEGHDYILHTDTNTIELLNHQNPILKGTETEFVVIKLENVQLNKINAAAGNKIAVELEDFVYHTKTNETAANSGNYTITYPDDTTGTLVYADYTAPVISELRIEDSKQEQDVNPDVKGVNQTLYTNDQNVNLVLNLGAESSNYGSGVKIISLTNNATFTTTGADAEITKIFVDGIELSASDYTLNSTNVNFGNKVFTAANVIKFTNVNILNGDDKTNQTIKAQLTDFVGLSSAVATDAIVFDKTPAVITSINWVAPEGVAKGSANTNEVTDQTLKVDFTEATAGVKVIKFDVTYDGDSENAASYDAPFSMTNFKLYYGDTELTSADYAIADGRYIVLNTPRFTGSFTFENLKLRNVSAEGEYNIKITLLDAAENKNAQTESSIYNKKIFIDTTVPVVEKVLIEDAQKREVYNDSSNTKLWWMPSSKFDSEGALTKASLQITVNEAGSGLKVIKLSENAEFTSGSKLKKGSDELIKDTDYVLDTTENTITLLDYEEPELRGSSTAPSVVFTLENVKLNNINDADGNKIAVTVEDFVTNPGSNRISQTENYKIFYPDDSDGTLIFADFQNPAITTLAIEDSAHNAVTNPDNKAWDKDNYTDSQDVTLILTLAAEDTDAGSGVKVITLTDNAEFTDDTAIYVDGTELTSGFTWATNKKSVEFSKVFIAANEIKFTNVHIISEAEASQQIKAKLTDFVGLEATVKTSDNSVTLDQINPVVDSAEWVVAADDDATTAGITKNTTVTDQTLKVSFTEATSGVKVIKLDVTLDDGSTPYANPFDFENLAVTYGDTVNLTKDVDYSVDGPYIILTTPRKSSSFSFNGIKLNEQSNTEGTYTVKVTLQDAAERIGDKSETISIDSVKPVIDGTIRIHDLKKSLELTTSTTSNSYEYWLAKEHVNGTDGSTAKTPDKIPVYVSIIEKGSGVKVLTFSDDVILTSATKLYVVNVDSSSNETSATEEQLTEISSDKYSISSNKHTITITDKDDAKTYLTKQNASGEEVPFIILVDNVSFKNEDSSTSASSNSITLTLSDVAKNGSVTAYTNESTIKSDSRAPAAPENLTLKDRKVTAYTVKAADGYTNESIIDMTFDLSASEKFGSGYYKFVLTGATFKKVDTENTANATTIATDATILTMKNGDSEIQNLAFDISEDGRTLTLKKSGQTAEDDYYAVVRQAVNVTLNNIHLDIDASDENGDNGNHPVTLTAYDLTGWSSETVSKGIVYDSHAPVRSGQVFAANYSNVSYYVPSVNVYPHASGETAAGVDVIYSINGGQKTIPTFYTATTYEADKSTSNGEVVTDTYGAVLGIRGLDNISLGGYAKTDKTFLYYVEGYATTTGILASENVYKVSKDINNDIAPTDDNNSETSAALWFGFKPGIYSAVIVDDAGNVSQPFNFSVVQDNEKPDVTGMQNRVLLMRPDESSNVYRNATAVVSTTTDFADFKAYNSSSTLGIKNLKYVTKIAENKYKIILNLGSAYSSSNLVSKINGASTSSVTGYAELNATTTSAPIESYVISTWYGSWPTALDSTVKFTPVVPYGTTFPSGQELKPSARNDSLALMACNYFGGDSTFQSYWRMYWSDQHYKNGVWPLYSHESGVNEDKVNKINSYVDENNNLVIEVPNDVSTAPISVFLRDGCGNMNFVVLGLDTDSDGKETAVSFITDNKLGGVTATNGRVSTLSVMQNPFMSLTQHPEGKTNKKAWTNGGTKLNFYWNYQGGTGDSTTDHGVGGLFGFFKDKNLGATYYNPRIYIDSDNIKEYTDSEKLQWSKIGLSLRWGDKEADTPLESVMFTSSTETAILNTDLASTNSAYDYTCRALLYCTIDEDEPSYADIVNSHIEGRTGDDAICNGDTGFRTEWVGARAEVTENTLSILLDYPQPDYDLLGWTVNDSETHVPVPYYIWYIYEDRVGNYELAKVVNSKFTDNGAAGSDKPLMDKWLYDGKAPVVTVVDTNKTPSQIVNDAEEVAKLVSDNNGYVPYLDTTNKRIWVSSYDQRPARDSSLIKHPEGWGVTNVVENGSNKEVKREYLPFANLEVSKEITGIRAFCWSTSSTAPAYTYTLSTDNTQGDRYDATDYPYGAWYAGSGATTTAADIGFNYSYTNSVNAYMPYGAGNTYAGKYSGTKINSIIPQNLISTSADTVLYLHVMDWTGNIASYRMGSSASGLKFKNDIAGISWNSSDESTKSEDEHYYVTNQLKIVIAGAEAGSAGRQETMKVFMPDAYFSDEGSGFAGYVFGKTLETVKIEDIKKENGKPYLEIPYSAYKDWTGELVDFYCFDNVGNLYNSGTSANPNGKACLLTGVYDTVAPAYASVSFVTESGQDTEFAHTAATIAKADGTKLNEIKTVSGYGKVTDFSPRTATKHTNISDLTADEVQEIWVNKKDTSRFHINLTENISDFDDAIINKWNGEAWERVSSWKTRSTSTASTADSWNHGGVTYRPNLYTLLDFASTGTYYQIVTKDLAGNNSYQYFKLYLDNQAPTFAEDPEITITKGSINKDASLDQYYYTADSTNPMTLKFTLADGDNGVGTKIASDKIHYSYRFGTSGTWTTLNTANLSRDFTGNSDPTLESIYIKDELGNESTTPVVLKYKYGENNASTKEMSKLEFYNTAIGNSTYSATAAKYEWNGWSGYQLEWNPSNVKEVTGGICLKAEDMKNVKLTFNPPTGVIGYLDLQDGETPSEDVGAYNFNTSLAKEFTYDLPLAGEENTSDVTKHYYAIDYVGKYQKIDVTYTYTNPDQAQNVEFIDRETSLAKIGSKLEADGISLTYTNKQSSNMWYKDGYITLRCTLPSIASDYNDAPKSVQLYDGTGWNANKLGNEITGSSLNVYHLDESDNDYTTESGSKRYYYYLIFKIGNEQKDSTIYATVIGNNQSESKRTKIVNATWKRDNTAPVIQNKNGGTFVNDSTKDKNNNKLYKLYNYEITDREGNILSEVQKAKDNSIVQNKETNLYTNGSSIYIRMRKDSSNIFVLDDASGIAKYKFVITNQETQSDDMYNATASAADTTGWNTLAPAETYNSDMFWGQKAYKFELPNVEEISPHSHIALFLMDAVGNISVPYYLGNKTDANVQWWLLDRDPSEINITKANTTQAPEWNKNTTSYDFDVNFGDNGAGVIIKSITAENASVESVSFNGYSDQPTYNKATGKFASDQSWVNISGLKITLKPNERAWTDKVVKLIVNGVEQTVFTVPSKPLSSSNGDITISSASWQPDTFTYTLNVETKKGATTANIKDIVIDSSTAENANVTWAKNASDNTKATVTLSNVAGQSWDEDKYVNLVVENLYSSDDLYHCDTDLSMGSRLTIPKIAASDITISSRSWATDGTAVDGKFGTKEFTFDVTYPQKAAVITSVESDYGTLTLGTSTSSDTARGTATLKLQVSKDWVLKTPTFTIKGVEKSSGFTVPAIEASDITVKQVVGDSATDSYSWDSGVNVTEGDDAKKTFNFQIERPYYASAITGVTPSGGATASVASSNFTTNPSTVSVRVTKAWDAKELKLKVENGSNYVEKNIFTDSNKVPALEDGDISITNEDGSALAYNRGTTSYNLKIHVNGDVAITEIIPTPTNITGSWNADTSIYSMTVSPTWSNQNVSLKVNGHTKDIFTVTPKPLASSSITISSATWVDDKFEYDLGITMNDGASLANIKDIEIDSTTSGNATIEWTSGSNIVKLKNVVGQSWTTDQYVKLVVKNQYSNDSDVEIGTVLTIPKIDADDITIIAPTAWDNVLAAANDDGTKDLTFTVTYPKKAADIESVSSTDNIGRLTLGTVTPATSTSKGSATLTFNVSKDWVAKTPDFTIEGVTKTSGFTIPALEASDIKVKQVVVEEGAEAEEQTFTWAGGTNVTTDDDAKKKFTFKIYRPKDSTAITAVDKTIGQLNTSECDLTSNPATVSITITKDWAEQELTLTVAGSGSSSVDKEIFTGTNKVPALNADDIAVKRLIGQNNQTVPVSWTDVSFGTNRTKTYNLEFVINGDPTIKVTNVRASYGTLSWTNGTNSATLTVAPDWTQKDVILYFNEYSEGNGGLSKSILTVPAIDADDITVSPSQDTFSWSDGSAVEGNSEAKNFTFHITLPGNATTITSVSPSIGSVVESATNYTTSPATVTVQVTQTWSAQDLSLTIKHDPTSVEKIITSDTNKIPAKNIKDGDVELTAIASTAWNADLTSYDVEVKLNNGAGIANLANVTLSTNFEGVTADFKKADGEIVTPIKITLSGDALKKKSWTDTDVNVILTVGGTAITPIKALTIPKYSASDFTLTVEKSWDEVTADANGYKTFEITIPAPADIPADTVTSNLGVVTFDAENKKATVKVKEQGWTDTAIVLHINGVDVPTSITVPARTVQELTAADIELIPPTWVSGTTEYTVPITLKNGTTVDKISGVTCTTNGVTATLDKEGEDAPKITLTNLPACKWNETQVIQIKFNNNDSIVKTAITLPVRQITAEDIKLTPPTWVSGTTQYSVPITLNNDAPVYKLTSVTCITEGVSATLDAYSQGGPKITLTGVPAHKWDEEQVIEVKFNNNDNIVKTAITVPERVLQASDIGVRFTTWSGPNFSQFWLKPVPSEVTIDTVIIKLKDNGDPVIPLDDFDGVFNECTPSVEKWEIHLKNGKKIPSGPVVTVKTNKGDVDLALYNGETKLYGTMENDSDYAGWIPN